MDGIRGDKKDYPLWIREILGIKKLRKEGGGEAGGNRSKHRQRRRCRPPKRIRAIPHPRTLYKGGTTDVRALAARFPDLMDYITVRKNGKMKLDFEDRESLCMVTRAIVKRDFGLDVVLPFNKMVPCVQMRYNYLLWMEDLLDMWHPGINANSIYGIDIGAHASCLYSLIAAKKNKWCMLTSEYDDEIYNMAQHNVMMNNLQHFINVQKVNERTLLEGLVDPDVPYYDFCMFSPPVFCDKDARILLGTGSDGRLLPLDKLTGRAAEVMAAGGEANFMRKIVVESLKLRNKIKIFSFMVGRQKTLDKLGPALQELVGDDYVAAQVLSYWPRHTYGVAWTFDKSVKIKNEKRVEFKVRKERVAVKFEVVADLDGAFSRVITMLEKFMVNYTVLEKTDTQYCIEMNTYYEFWTENGRERALNSRKKMESNDWPDWKRRKLDGGQMMDAPSLCNPSSSDSSVTFFPQNNIDAINNRSMPVPSNAINGDSWYRSRTFHSGDIFVLEAKISVVKVDANHVSIEILPLGGTAGWIGGCTMIEFFQSEWDK